MQQVQAAQTKVPIKYLGKLLHWRDTTYGSLAGFTRGKVTAVPAWVAAKLLKHPEFEDARPRDKRSPILDEAPRRAPEEELQELQQIEQHVQLQHMTREQAAAHALRAYGQRVDATQPRDAVLDAVRSLVKTRRAL